MDVALANSHDLHVRQLLPATTAAAEAATNREHIELSLTRQQVDDDDKNKKRERETPVTGVERQKANAR